LFGFGARRGAAGQGLFGDRMSGLGRRGRVEPEITEKDVCPLFVGNGPLTSEQETALQKLVDRNPGHERELRALVIRIRTAADVEDAEFRNPFSAGLTSLRSLDALVFGMPGLGWASQLSTKACKYVIKKMSQGIGFSTLFDIMTQLSNDLEQVEEFLS
jgi:hypothetical protein